MVWTYQPSFIEIALVLTEITILNTDNKGRSKKIFFFSRLNRLPNKPTEILIRVVKKKKFENYFSTTHHIDGNTDNKGRTTFKNFFFWKKMFFSTGSTTQHIDGNTDKGRTNFKIFFFWKKCLFDWIDYPTDTNISTEILIIRVERKKTNFRNFFFDYPIEPDAMLLGSYHDPVFFASVCRWETKLGC